MARTLSTMLPLGTKAPYFKLPEPKEGHKLVSLDDFPDAKAYVVMFICNHCPFVIHVRDVLFTLCHDLIKEGAAVVAISANDAVKYPDDGPEAIGALAREFNLSFPYLYDEQQTTARAFQAACTPDFFVFAKDRTLTYRGQMDGSRPGNDVPVTGADLAKAVRASLAGKGPIPDQQPSLGCNIKWKPGNEA